MFAAMDSCFSLFGSHEHGMANKQTLVPTEKIRTSESVTLMGCDLNSKHQVNTATCVCILLNFAFQGLRVYSSCHFKNKGYCVVMLLVL